MIDVEPFVPQLDRLYRNKPRHLLIGIDFSQVRCYIEFNTVENDAARDRLTFFTIAHYIKGIAHTTMEIRSLITVITCKTFVHLQNTNEDIFAEIREHSDPAQTATQLRNIQGTEGSEDIVKIVY